MTLAARACMPLHANTAVEAMLDVPLSLLHLLRRAAD